MTWDDIALKHGTDKASNLHAYMGHYERILAGRDVRTVCEIGVHEGASLRTWADIWPDAFIVGIDIVELAHDPWPGNADLIVGDGPTELSHIGALYGRFDVIIDDGSHEMADTVRTIAVADAALAEDGVLVIEDVLKRHTKVFPHSLDDVVAALHEHGFVPTVIPSSHTGSDWVGDLCIVFAERA